MREIILHVPAEKAREIRDICETQNWYYHSYPLIIIGDPKDYTRFLVRLSNKNEQLADILFYPYKKESYTIGSTKL